MMLWFLCALVALLLVAVAFVVRAVMSIQQTLSKDSTAHISTGIVSVQSEQARVAQELGRAATALGSLQGLQQSVESSLRTLSGQAAVRAEASAQSQEVLKRLELVIAGSFQRGVAGENLLSEVLATLPPGMLDRDLRVSGGTVEFAVRLPGGKFIPIDSKWPGAHLLERLGQEKDVARRTQLVRQVEAQVAAKAEEVAKYLDPERTLLLGIAALPDAVYHLCRGVHAQAYKRGIIVLPYSLAVPYVLSLFVLISRFGGALDTSRVRTSLARIDETLQRLEESLESHVSRGLTMLSNAIQNQRSGVAECRSAVASLRARDEATSLGEDSGVAPTQSVHLNDGNAA